MAAPRFPGIPPQDLLDAARVIAGLNVANLSGALTPEMVDDALLACRPKALLVMALGFVSYTTGLAALQRGQDPTELARTFALGAAAHPDEKKAG